MWRTLAALALVAGCSGGPRPPAPVEPAPAVTPAPNADPIELPPETVPAGEGEADEEVDPAAYPDKKTGWKHVDDATRALIDAYAVDYASFLSTAKTPRKAVAELLAAFGAATYLEAGDTPETAAGSRLYFSTSGGDAAAFVVAGKRPVEEGARIIIAAVDAPRIDLKQSPIYDEAGFAMLDTFLYGDLDLKSWLSQPLALHLYAARPGAKDGDVDLVVGEDPTDPVFVIPDLLPHLSRKVQRRKIVDSAERMDAIGARTRKALVEYLAGEGIDEAIFATAEASLVPAGPAQLIGVDRAMVAGYGHSHRAFAYAAVRALAAAEAPMHTAIVIVISKSQIGYTGDSGTGFVKSAMSRIIGALAASGIDSDVLDTRRIYTRSAALIAHRSKGQLNDGLILDPGSDDALPEATRRVLDTLDGAGAAYQLADEPSWGSPARSLATLDMDVVQIAIPTTGHSSPLELMSTLDLYQAHLAGTAWLTE